MRMVGLAQGNFSAGIMGPGRPFMPLGIGSLAQGFRPFGGIVAHGRPQVHLQDVLAQEQLMRAHALKLAQETLANAMRAPITGPFSAVPFRPFLGLDMVGPGPHAPKHFLRPPDLLGHMGSCARGDNPNLDTARGLRDRGLGEPSLQEFGWTAASFSGDLKRGRGWGRGGLRPDAWGNSEPLGLLPGGLPPQTMIMKSHMKNLTPDEIPFVEAGLGVAHIDRNAVHNQFDARWKIERERILRHSLPQFRTFDHDIKFSDKSVDLGKNVSGKPLPSQGSSRSSGSLAGRLGPTAEAKAATLTSSSNSVDGSNMIKLLQPVRKSRVLTVSGLPEDTPMSTVAEVFEKLGKITDFTKNPSGDTFTIGYSNETEAVSAKRSLHRSYLAGKQITVAYAHE